MSAAVRGLQAGFQMGESLTDNIYKMAQMRDMIEQRKRDAALRERLKGVLAPPATGAAAQGLGATPAAPTVGSPRPPSAPAVPPSTTPATSPIAAYTPGGPLETREQLEAAVRHHAIRNGLDPELVLRQVEAESAFDPRAVSPRGAKGLMQIMPATGAKPGFGVTPLQNDSIDENIRFGTDYYAAMLRETGGNPEHALAAYNAGLGTVRRAGGVPNIRETQDYVAKIMNGGVDARMADTGDQPALAVSPHTLPSRTDAGLPAPPRADIAPAVAKYNELMAVMAEYPEAADQIQPIMALVKQQGLAAWASQFDQDPSTVRGSFDYIQHMQRGAMQFGEPVDPALLFTASRQMAAEERSDRNTVVQERYADVARAESTRKDVEFAQTQEDSAFERIMTALEQQRFTAAEKIADSIGIEVRNIKPVQGSSPITGIPMQNVTFEYREKGSHNDWVKSSTIDYAVQQVQESMRPQVPRAEAPMSPEEQFNFDRNLNMLAPKMCEDAMGQPCTPEELADFIAVLRQRYQQGGGGLDALYAPPDETDDDIIPDLRKLGG